MRTLLIGLLLLAANIARADLADVATGAEDTARNAFIQRFLVFTQEKNVMGRATTPDTKKKGGGPKTKFNPDDGVAFQSDLTYHDYSYRTDEDDPNDKNSKRTLPNFVSPHGKLTSGSGSSILERTVWNLHNKYAKEAEDAAKKNGGKADKPQQNGVELRDVFKITTQEVTVPKAQVPGTPPPPPGTPPATEKETNFRSELRDDVKKAVEDVGANSYEGIAKAGKDAGYQDDAKTMPNMTFLYEAASRATQSMWNSTLANLAQRRVEKNVGGLDYGDSAKLSEDLASCEDYQQQLQGKIAKVPQGTPQYKDLQDQIKSINSQCKAMASTPFNAINPRFDTDAKGVTTLKADGPKDEDGVQRDLRNQLEVMASAGKSVKDLTTNYKYDPNLDKSQLQGYDNSGNSTGVQARSVRDQINNYNQQVQEAAAGLDEVKKRIPNLQIDTNAVLGFQIQPESASVMDINQAPPGAMDEFGKVPNRTTPTPQNYDQLLDFSAKE